MRIIKFILPAAVLLSGIAVCTSTVYGTQEFAKKEKKACTFCHAKAASDKAEMAKNLNTVGTCYKTDGSLAKCGAPAK